MPDDWEVIQWVKRTGWPPDVVRRQDVRDLRLLEIDSAAQSGAIDELNRREDQRKKMSGKP